MTRSAQKFAALIAIAATAVAAAPQTHAQGPDGALTPQQWEEGGDAAIIYHDYATAIGSYEQAVAGDPKNTTYLSALSRAYTHEGRFADARKLLTDRIPQFGPEDQKKLTICLSIVETNWRDALHKEGKVSEGISHLETAYTLEQNIRPLGAGFYQMLMGDDWSELRNLPKALAANDLALRIARQIRTTEKDSHATELETLADLSRGRMLLEASQLKASLDYFQQALDCARQYHPEHEYVILQGMSYALFNSGEYQRAKTCNAQIRTIAQQRQDIFGEVHALCVIGDCEIRESQFGDAVSVFQEALTIAQKSGKPADAARVLRGLGDVYTFIGSYDRANDYYAQAAASYEEAGDAKGALSVRISRYHSSSNSATASQNIADLKELLETAQKNGDREAEKQIWGALAGLYSWTDAYKQKQCQEEALRLERSFPIFYRSIYTLVSLGDAERKLGQHHLAQTHFDEALALARQHNSPEEEAYIVVFNAALFRSMGRSEDDAKLIERSLPLYRQADARRFEAFAFEQLMFSYSIAGKKELAIFYGKQAVRDIETIRANALILGPQANQMLLQRDWDVYRTLLRLLIEQGRLPEAQQVYGLMKRKEFHDFAERGEASTEASSTNAVTFTPQETEWRDRYAKIADQVTAIGQKREELLARKEKAQIDPAAFTEADKKSLTDADRDLVVANTAFQSALTQMAAAFAKPGASPRLAQVGEVSALSDTLHALGPGTVALYTIVEADKYRVIVVTSQTQKAEEYPISSSDLNKKILALREALQDPSIDPRPLAQDLYKILIGPIEKDLAGAQAKTLMWSLDGALRYLPIATLYDGKQYLVERYRSEVFTLASQSRLEDEPAARWSALGLGVSKAQPGFTALPAVPEELHGIIQSDAQTPGGVLPGAVLLDADFTRASMVDALEGRKYPVVHIASHFSFRPGSDSDSFLLLGDGSHLTLADLKTLPKVFQGVDLLTLSACDTAMSAGDDGSGGREIEGCAVIAQRQGARSVLASLWPVADESTQMLMRAFYQYRETHPGASKAEALQAAQITLLHGDHAAAKTATRGAAPAAPPAPDTPDYTPDAKAPFAHPYYWAPFILIGNWK